MSRTLNKVMLIGNVGKTPELKYTANGTPFTHFRMATSETWKDHEGTLKEHTDWHTIVAWRGLAEIITKLVRKGSRVFIEGRLQTRFINNEDENLHRQVVEVLAENMLILDNKFSVNENEHSKEDSTIEKSNPSNTEDENQNVNF